jgi:hypothetical protein
LEKENEFLSRGEERQGVKLTFCRCYTACGFATSERKREWDRWSKERTYRWATDSQGWTGGRDPEGRRENQKERVKRREKCKSSPPSPMPAPEAWRWYGYENPDAENQGFTSRGGSRTHALFRFTTTPRRIPPQYR